MVGTELILQKGPIRAFEPFDRFAQFEGSKGKKLADLLLQFEPFRKDNLSNLRSKNLAPEDLDLLGTHPELGEITLAQLLSAWVVHDLGHIAQISKVMAKEYWLEVRPWSKYLTILSYIPKE
ncbi:MAG: hypothetical protein ABJN84_14200 [Flavobacteriaceae bacterium]